MPIMIGDLFLPEGYETPYTDIYEAAADMWGNGDDSIVTGNVKRYVELPELRIEAEEGGEYSIVNRPIPSVITDYEYVMRSLTPLLKEEDLDGFIDVLVSLKIDMAKKKKDLEKFVMALDKAEIPF